jgi:hypothetical protein
MTKFFPQSTFFPHRALPKMVVAASMPPRMYLIDEVSETGTSAIVHPHPETATLPERYSERQIDVASCAIIIRSNTKRAPLSFTQPHIKATALSAGTLTQRSSIIVFLVAMFSLITSLISGFNLIHPLFSVLTCVAAIGFYIMGRMLNG